MKEKKIMFKYFKKRYLVRIIVEAPKPVDSDIITYLIYILSR